MKTSRTVRLFTALVAILSMLFMQHAVASYLCPGVPMGVGSSVTSAGVGVSAMPARTDCAGMDTDQSTLCQIYAVGDASRQSLDKTPVADQPSFVPVVLLLTLAIYDTPVVYSAKPPLLITLARPTAPPIAIRHCCLRI